MDALLPSLYFGRAIVAQRSRFSPERAFELLRNTAERSNYLLTKQARIVAMTCTHAAMRRADDPARDSTGVPRPAATAAAAGIGNGPRRSAQARSTLPLRRGSGRR